MEGIPAYVWYPYTGTDDTQLTLNEGDYVTVTQYYENWCYCICGNREGYFPTSYLDFGEEEDMEELPVETENAVSATENGGEVSPGITVTPVQQDGSNGNEQEASVYTEEEERKRKEEEKKRIEEAEKKRLAEEAERKRLEEEAEKKRLEEE
ncbi:hypothetical protein WA588_003698, partial [Blastocystis sp. NMH]